MNAILPLLGRKGAFTADWPGYVIWITGWLVMPLVDGAMTLGTMAMLLVLTSTLAALWLRPKLTLLLCLVSVLVFNFAFVPPRFTFGIEIDQYLWLLLVMFSVSVLVALLMTLLREHASKVEQQAQMIGMLRNWGDTLRDAADVLDCVPKLQQLLIGVADADAAVMVLRDGPASDNDPSRILLAGMIDGDQMDRLWQCLRKGVFASHDGAMYLPLRGRSMAYGAALVRAAVPAEEVRSQLQALCDQMGTTLERQHGQKLRLESEQTAHDQMLRATLLTSIAHDYRTPLATIMGAASALDQQDARLSQLQRRQLAHRIVDESQRLRQMTTNILELVRLDTPGVKLKCDWESAEELVEGVVKRCREPGRLQLKVETGLPLLWCDPLLISQLLDNLVDNACKYSSPASPIHLVVSNGSTGVVFRVTDQGPGIPDELQQLVFQPFHQGEALTLGGRTGVGLGLALCRIVASVHGSELQLRSSKEGSSFEFSVPHRVQPSLPVAEAALS